MKDYLQALAAQRAKIDKIDDEILKLLNRRTTAVAEVGHLKSINEPNAALTFYRPDREICILRRLTDNNPGPLGNESVSSIFREIISQSLSFEQRQIVAYLGPEGTFSEEAAVKHFGTAPEYVPYSVFDDVLNSVTRHVSNVCVLPIENSTEGAVGRVLDLLVDTSLKICAEINLPVHQNVLCLGDLSNVKVVYSHQQSLSQCYRWLNDHMPHVERIPVSSNGEAARLASHDPGVCAIAGEIAAKRFPNLNIIHRNIEDMPNNTTRFVVLGPEDAATSTGNDKTTIVMAIKNRVGAMYDLIRPLKDHNVSMTHFESRPAKSAMKNSIWEYVFFADLVGHRLDQPVAKALEELKNVAGFVKVLGSYPKALD